MTTASIPLREHRDPRVPQPPPAAKLLRRVDWQRVAIRGDSLSVVTDDYPQDYEVARLDSTRKLAAEVDAIIGELWDHPLNNRANRLSKDGTPLVHDRTGRAYEPVGYGTRGLGGTE